MSDVSEKHMDRARQIVWSVANEDMDAGQVAAALANAEREGMKRAAEIARDEAKKSPGSILIPIAANIIADRILSEAGEG